jgi:hypothetical protein
MVEVTGPEPAASASRTLPGVDLGGRRRTKVLVNRGEVKSVDMPGRHRARRLPSAGRWSFRRSFFVE